LGVSVPYQNPPPGARTFTAPSTPTERLERVASPRATLICWRDAARSRGAAVAGGRAMPSLKDHHVVVTGGTGALGRAVVADLVDAGVHCHVPCVSEEELARFDLRDHARVSCELGVDLTDEG